MTRNAWLVELARLLVAAQRDMQKAPPAIVRPGEAMSEGHGNDRPAI